MEKVLWIYSYWSRTKI